jgi:hypothetical protein
MLFVVTGEPHATSPSELDVHRERLGLRLLRACCLVSGSLAAGYLWAVLFGDGIHGLTSGATLDHRPNADLPNANVAFVVAVLVYFASPMYAWWWTEWPKMYSGALVRWGALTATAGLAVFGVSRLFRF